MLITTLSSFICSWLTISSLLILYLLIGKPGKFLLDLDPQYLKLPLPNKNDKIFSRKRKQILKPIVKICQDEILNPISLTLDPDGQKFYIGSSTGDIYLVENTDESDEYSISKLFSFGPGSKPMGMRLFRNILYFIEANSGLYSFDLNQNSLKHLLCLDATESLDQRNPSKFFDDLVVVDEDDQIIIYIADVSRKFSPDMWCYTYLEPDCTGRILRFNVNLNKLEVVKDNLCFPNGIEITHQKDSLLICELTKRRILELKLKEPERGKTRVLIDNLPGEPQNIRRNCSKNLETFWIGIASARDYTNKLTFLDDYSTEPCLRKLILRTCFVLGSLMRNMGFVFNSEILKTKGLKLKSGLALILDDVKDNPGMAIEIDLNSNILSTFQIDDEKTFMISEIQEVLQKSNHLSTRILYTTSSVGYLTKVVLKN